MGGDSPASPGILVVDQTGTVFSLLRSLKIGQPLWRTASIDDLDLEGIGLTVLAVYGDVDWLRVSELAGRTTTILIATRPNTGDAGRSITAGALGYVDAGLRPDAMRRAIRGVLQGEHGYSRRALATMIRGARWRSTRVHTLTPRQLEVVHLIARGAGDKEIARSLGIATATAQKHVTNLLRRLNVPNRAAAVAAMTATYIS